jgi:glycosyltransferase involved in cell wall biosynthesis
VSRLTFVVTEDWFFASHFLPLARAAREIGLDVAVVTRVRDHRGAIEAVGADVVPFEAERRSLNPIAAGDAAGRLAAIFKRLRPDLVHCIALRSILVGGAACAMAGIDRRVYALTGLGLLGARADAVGAGARWALRTLIRGPLGSRGARHLVENEEDARTLGLDPADRSRVTLVGGAGIDPDHFRPSRLPDEPGLRLAIVARMLWSKGIDLAVEATALARAAGQNVSLDLYGSPDPSNRRAISEATLREWSARPGIAWHGPATDVAAVWRGAHLACLPSRGGEGLPRTLLEAAGCGRGIVTTDVPGCRRFVRDGVEGLVVQPGDPRALADALVRLARDPGLVARMGDAARARVLDGFTEQAVADDVKRLYREMLGGGAA